MQIGLVLKADKDGDMVLPRRLFEDGVGLSKVVALLMRAIFSGRTITFAP